MILPAHHTFAMLTHHSGHKLKPLLPPTQQQHRQTTQQTTPPNIIDPIFKEQTQARARSPLVHDYTPPTPPRPAANSRRSSWGPPACSAPKHTSTTTTASPGIPMLPPTHNAAASPGMGKRCISLERRRQSLDSAIYGSWAQAVVLEPSPSLLACCSFSSLCHAASMHVLSTHPLTKPADFIIHSQATHFILLFCRCGVVWRALGSAGVPVDPTLLAAPQRRPTEMVPLPPPPLLPPRPSSSLATPPFVVFYIVRHGESTGNRGGVLQGQRDYSHRDRATASRNRRPTDPAGGRVSGKGGGRRHVVFSMCICK